MLIVAVIAVVYHGIYTIPFYYSEIAGIQRNPVVTSPQTFATRMLTPRGMLQRPLSVASYMLNYAAHGDRVAGFHSVNLAIHCTNALLVYALARGFFSAPLVAALVFGLHPLATACVSQIFGRNYSLATTFFLAAFYLYLRWRAAGALRAPQLAVLLVLYVLAVLTKQSFVVLPVVFGWYELGARNIGIRAAVAWLAASWRATFLYVATALAAYALIALYAIPLSKTATIPPATFLLSQLGNAMVVARFYLLPYQTALVHDLYLYRDFAHVEVWTGLALLVTSIVVAYRWRAHRAAWLLGALVICLLPTNSFLAKNEIVREWRLYPSLVFYALLVGEAVTVASRSLASRYSSGATRWVPQAVVAVYLVLFAHADVVQNGVYQTSIGAWKQVLERYPYSVDAMNNIGRQYYGQRAFTDAKTYFEKAVQAAPEVALYRYNLGLAYGALGERDAAGAHFQAAKDLRARYGSRGMTLHYR
jgi:tetratricopeptide (TPR) repeat protein